MLSKDKMYVVDIVDIGQGGVGIGKFDGFTVFVDGGLPYIRGIESGRDGGL